MNESVDSTSLLPCAFCGGAPVVVYRGRAAGDLRYASSWVDVACSACGIQTAAYGGGISVPADLNAASDIWNRRPG